MSRAKETTTGQVGLEKWLPTSLRCIEMKSTRESNARFESLYGLLNKENMRYSFEAMKKRSSGGVDGVTYEAFKNRINQEVNDLEKELKMKKYRTRPVKRVMIDKSDGKKRPLGLPVVRDKLIQTTCSQLLTAIYEPKFLDSSFGYRNRRGARQAVEYLSKSLNYSKTGYILELDIKGFFDNMDHDWLLKMLEVHIKDRMFTRLIRKWLKAKIITEDGVVIKPEKGTPQGGVISPVLANIYMHYALDIWLEKKVKPQLKGELIFCRYADDVICSFQYQGDALRVMSEIESRLEKFKLELSKEKTRLIRFSRFQKEVSGTFTFLGFAFRWEKSRKGKDIITHKTSKKRQKQSIQNISRWIKEQRHCRLRKFFDGLNLRLRGYYNYFGIIGNSVSLAKVDIAVKRAVFKWLNRRSGRRSFNWIDLYRAFSRYELVKPFIVYPDNRIGLNMCW